MYIRRDYSQPFFSNRRRRRGLWRWLLLYVLLITGFLFLVDSQFNRLQLMALEMVGQAPPPTPFASELATRGLERFMAGDLPEAASLLRQAVAQQPNNVDYLYEYGRILLELGVDDEDFYTEAVTIGDQAILANANDPRGYTLKARALSLAGDAANAVPVGQAGLNVDRNFAPLHYALSDAYRRIDRYDVALESAERAIELDPLDPTARRIYAYALIWVGRRDEAIEQLEQAVGLNPNLAAPYFELAGMYLNRDEYEAAIATYEQILAMQPENARAYQRMCDAFFRANENVRAQGYCEDALTQRPDYAQAWASLGQVQYSRRNYEGAIDSFEQCLTYGGEDADIRCFYLRGLAHYYLGQCDDAWNILGDSVVRIRAISLDLDNDPVLNAALEGLRLITVSCSGYSGRALPTAIPPTAIPPTPIGG